MKFQESGLPQNELIEKAYAIYEGASHALNDKREMAPEEAQAEHDGTMADLVEMIEPIAASRDPAPVELICAVTLIMAIQLLSLWRLSDEWKEAAADDTSPFASHTALALHIKQEFEAPVIETLRELMEARAKDIMQTPNQKIYALALSLDELRGHKRRLSEPDAYYRLNEFYERTRLLQLNRRDCAGISTTLETRFDALLEENMHLARTEKAKGPPSERPFIPEPA